MMTTTDTHDPKPSPLAPKQLDPELQEDAKARRLSAIAYDPGFAPGTSLFRGWPPMGAYSDEQEGESCTRISCTQPTAG
jgi:hypothetical protein